MKKILAFGASNSKSSINKTFATYAARQLENVEVMIADLNDYTAPLYSIDLQKEQGIDENVMRFYQLIQTCDAIVLSLAEHNGLHTSVFKNLWDWLSRIPMEQPMQIWGGKPMFLLSTSTSRRAMSNVLKVSKEMFPHFGANIIADFQLPSFYQFFKDGQIIEAEYQALFDQQKSRFQEYLDNMV
ncbi:MAG: NAD(P)H-dependent oxidoreductase [Bacteroidota bacterium]